MIPERFKENPAALAATLMVVAILFFTFMDSIARGLAQRIDPMQVVWGRYSFQTLISVIFLAPRLRKVLVTRYPGLQLIRSLLLFGATICFFFALSFLPLADTTAIFEIAPLLITLMAIFILGERVGIYRLFAVLLGLMGALVIIQPGSVSFTPALLLPVGAATCFAAYAIATRFLGREESPLTSFLYTAIIGTLLAWCIVPFYWQPLDIWAVAGLAAMGFFGCIGHYLLIRAFTLGEASFLAPFSYTSLIFNSLWGFLFYAEVPALSVWIGAAIIVGAGLFVWYRENRSAIRTRG